MKPRYVFIVGLPRTGTKLILNILRNSEQVDYQPSGETFFLGHFINPGVRDKLRKIGDMTDDARVHELVRAMYAGKFTGTYWNQLRNGHLGVDRETMLQSLLASNRTDKDIYEVLLRVHANVTEKTILGDKTPGHLYHVPTLLEWFPEAKIIHTFRDPRAILASEWLNRTHKKPTTYFRISPGHTLHPFTVVTRITILWMYAVRLHHKYQKLYPQNYYLSKFEDIISKPEKSISQLCEFLDIEFESQMLNPRLTGSNYDRQRGTGFDKQALTRWQGHLQPWMNSWLRFWGGKYLREFDYIS